MAFVNDAASFALKTLFHAQPILNANDNDDNDNNSYKIYQRDL